MAICLEFVAPPGNSSQVSQAEAGNGVILFLFVVDQLDTKGFGNVIDRSLTTHSEGTVVEDCESPLHPVRPRHRLHQRSPPGDLPE